MSDPLISEAMRRLGSRKSKRKANASRLNGSLGGRPLGSKDSQPRKRGLKSKPDAIAGDCGGKSERPEVVYDPEFSQE